MAFVRRGCSISHRGILGVESAIFLIAVMIISAALAVVVVNMGLSTTQNTKTVSQSGLNSAGSGLQLSGIVTGTGCTSSSKGCSTPYLNATVIPFKIVPGGNSMNLQLSSASVKYSSNSKLFDNIYKGQLPASTTYVDATAAFTAAGAAGITGFTNGVTNPVTKSLPSQTVAIVYWTVSKNTDAVLDTDERVELAIAYGTDDRPTTQDKIRVEIVTPTGATLAVERYVPDIVNTVVNLN
ncbi:flagellin [Candidatus Nitrosotenuis sp. DW1]|uniref:flagellin n=1 Tax=Candidatus Nitrosotenuis sp. DW1 TaxID=2259672 RepID=UPI0015C87621|nr:flagellin [Candidatus Nitrosotenuis sp. DW1]QLH09908.1 flagellin [Candidatus Nitrosotenuis sp. DW1]